MIGGGTNRRDDINFANHSPIVPGDFIPVVTLPDITTEPSESYLTISGAGSTVTAAGVNFGSLGQKKLRIEAGGKLFCDSFGVSEQHLITQPSDPISIVIDGAGSALECQGDIAFQRNQEYSFSVFNGARIVTKNSFYEKWPGVQLDISGSHTLVSDGIIPIDGLPGNTIPCEKTTIIDGAGSVWDNTEEYCLHYGAALIVRNSGQMNTRSLSISEGNLQLETSARVLVTENLNTRNGNIDLHGGGAIHVGTNATGDIPDGTIVVGDGGELDGDATVNGALVVESGGIVTCRRDCDYFLNPDITLNVDSIDLQPGGTLRIDEGKTGPSHGELTVDGDAYFSGVVEVGTFTSFIPIVSLPFDIITSSDPIIWPEGLIPARYFPEQPVLFDLITVDGICDWSEATLIVPEDEMNRYIMHEHGLRVLKTPPPGDANGDGVVDDVDATLLAANWHANGATWGMGDFDLDGDVDGEDMVILAGNWQKAFENLHPWNYNGDYPPLDMSQVPEPSTALLVLTGISILALHKRWRRKV